MQLVLCLIIFLVTNKDSTPPVISLNGSNPTVVELGSVYVEAGATADTGEPVVVSGSVNTNAVGTYTLTYTAIDDWGNVGTTTRTVNVVDTTAPVMSVTGDNPATVELGASYTDAGATGSDLGGGYSFFLGTVNTMLLEHTLLHIQVRTLPSTQLLQLEQLMLLILLHL